MMIGVGNQTNTATKSGDYSESETMDAVHEKSNKRTTLSVRIEPDVRNLIDCAAKARGKSRTDFVVDAARQAAEDTLIDRMIVTVGPQAYANFLARLDMQPNPSETLRRTMRTSPPWDDP